MKIFTNPDLTEFIYFFSDVMIVAYKICLYHFRCKECGFEEHSAVNRGKRRRGNLHDLHQAINANNLHAVEQVLAQGLSNINERIRGRTALYLAIEKDRSEICRLLLSPHAAHGLDMNRRSKDDKNCIEPPLVTACRKEDLETVKLLLRNGADIDIEDSYYHSSLWVAMRQRNMELAKLLIMNGASVNPTTKWYAAPVYHALKYTRRDNLAELLLMHGASLDIPGETRAKTIVYWAAFHGYTHIIPIMAAVGYNVTRETCIKTPDLNQKLSTNKTYCDWLALERASVPSLQGQCRIVIRKRMGEACRGKHFLRNLATLPLPRKMIEYLSLKDVATANGWQSPWQQSQEE